MNCPVIIDLNIFLLSENIAIYFLQKLFFNRLFSLDNDMTCI